MYKTCPALVCYTAAVSVVTQRSSPGSATGIEAAVWTLCMAAQDLFGIA